MPCLRLRVTAALRPLRVSSLTARTVSHGGHCSNVTINVTGGSNNRGFQQATSPHLINPQTLTPLDNKYPNRIGFHFGSAQRTVAFFRCKVAGRSPPRLTLQTSLLDRYDLEADLNKNRPTNCNFWNPSRPHLRRSLFTPNLGSTACSLTLARSTRSSVFI